MVGKTKRRFAHPTRLETELREEKADKKKQGKDSLRLSK